MSFYYNSTKFLTHLTNDSTTIKTTEVQHYSSKKTNIIRNICRKYKIKLCLRLNCFAYPRLSFSITRKSVFLLNALVLLEKHITLNVRVCASVRSSVVYIGFICYATRLTTRCLPGPSVQLASATSN